MSETRDSHTDFELEAVTIRRAGSEDEGALRRLADLDSTRVPDGPLLMAEIGGAPVAAISVLSGAPAKRDLGVKTLDVAKRLLDFGFHPPTIYFPLLVDEALMVEPTETETREALDALANAFDEILAEAESDPEIASNAPYTTPVRRLDEASASRRPVVRQAL